MKSHRVIAMILITFCFLLFVNDYFVVETFASELPSGIKDSEIGEAIDNYIEEHGDTTSSVSIAIFRGDKTVYQTSYGYTNIEDNIKADDESVYEWGSISKLLVWVSVMQLSEEGLIDLEEDIKEYLPENFFSKLKYDEPITMINLMNHNAGFEETILQTCPGNEKDILPLEEGLKATEPHQVYKPGEVVAYSNWTTALAGYIVEIISGRPYYQYVQDNIFEPLGMNRTGLEPTYADNSWVKEKLLEAEGYTGDLEPMKEGLYYMNLYPAGSAAGTLDDIVKFAKALVPNSKGSTKIFKNKETLTKMLSPTLKYPGTDIDYINHGFWSHEYNVQALGHGGNTDMYSAYLLFDPYSGVGTVILTNQGGETIYNYGVPPIIYGNVGEMAREDTKSDVSDMEGLYFSARTTLKGITKMYTAINIRPFIDDGEGNLSADFFGLAGEYANQIAPNTFILSQQVGSMELNSVARFYDDNGVKKLSSPYGQTIEADGNVWVTGISIVLYMVALIWSVVVLLISLIRFLLDKLKIIEVSHDSFKKYEIILCINILLLLTNIISVTSKMLGCEVPRTDLIINVIISIILAVVPMLYAIKLYRKWSVLRTKKFQKTSYVITMCMGFAVTLVVIVLEMYRI